MLKVPRVSLDMGLILVEALIMVCITLFIIEYRDWRKESGTNTVYEQVLVNFVWAVVVMTAVYLLMHRRAHMFGIQYESPAVVHLT